jgi:hypothetical protein
MPVQDPSTFKPGSSPIGSWKRTLGRIFLGGGGNDPLYTVGPNGEPLFAEGMGRTQALYDNLLTGNVDDVTIDHNFEAGWGYQLIGEGIIPRTDSTVLMLRVKVSGTVISANYAYGFRRQLIGLNSNDPGSTSDAEIQVNGDILMGTGTGEHCNFIIDIFSPASAGLPTDFQIHASGLSANPFYFFSVGSGFYTVAAAINGLYLVTDGATPGFSAGRFTLRRTRNT